MIQDWIRYRLDDLCFIVRGGSPRPIKKYITNDENGINWIKIGDTKKSGKYITSTSEKIIPEGVKKSRMVYENDFLLSNSMSFGRPYILKTSGCIHDGWLLIRIQNIGLDQEFLYYYLSSDFVYVQFNLLAGGSTVRNLNINLVKGLIVNLPPLPEQRKIAYILSTVQKAIEQQDKLIRTTTELKKALMQKLFTEGTRGEKLKETEIGLVPDSWEVVELGEVCEKPQYGFTSSASKQGNAKFLRITDIKKYGVNWNEVPFCNCNDFKKYELKNGDIVFARIGATTGKSYLINNPPKSVYASYLIRVRCKSNILSEYLIYYFNTERYWYQINSTKGNNLKGGVNGSILSKLLIPVPRLNEQNNIADIFKILDKKNKFYQKKKQTLTDLFKTLLHELMTGQRRVHEIDFENIAADTEDHDEAK